MSTLLRPLPLFHPRILPKSVEGHAFPDDLAAQSRLGAKSWSL